jgi:hypothetical protein
MKKAELLIITNYYSTEIGPYQVDDYLKFIIRSKKRIAPIRVLIQQLNHKQGDKNEEKQQRKYNSRTKRLCPLFSSSHGSQTQLQLN